MGTAAVPWTLDMKPEKFSEGKFASKNEESGCDEKKSEVVPEVVTLAKQKKSQ